MIYIRFTNADIERLSVAGIATLFAEVDLRGVVIRELGFDSDGNEVHRAPSEHNRWGLFDNQLIDMENVSSDISADTFERAWTRETPGSPTIHH